MADHTIQERIALDGGKDIEKEFAALGDAGLKAYKLLQKASQELARTSETSKFFNQVNKDVVALQKRAAELGKTYKELGSATREFALHIAELSAVIVEAGVGLFELAKRSSETADATDKAAQSTGLAIDTYGRLQFAFEQSNVGADQFGIAMKKLNTNIAEAAAGTGAGAKLFDSLGVSVKDVNGNLIPTDKILQALADKFQRLPDGPRKSQLAIELFGKAGAAIIPVLNQGGEEMQKLGDKAVALGLVLDKSSGKIGENFARALNEVKRSITGISTQVGLQLAPAFTEAFKAISDVIVANRVQILAFTKVLVDQLGPAIKDIVNALAGNDSAVVNKNFIQVRDTVVAIGQALGIVASIVTFVFNQLVDLVRPFVEIFNEIFGTKFTAQAAVIAGLVFGLTGGFKVLGLGIKFVSESWSLLVFAFKSSAGLVGAVIVGVVAAIATIQNAIDDVGFGVRQLFDGIVQDFTQMAGLPTLVAQAWQAVFGAVVTALNVLISAFQNRTLGIFQGLADTIVGFFTDLGKTVGGILDTVIKDIQAAIKFALTLGGLLGSGDGSSTSSGGGGFARGGHVRGPGTGTSDSIRAWLSDGEYVVRASAVSKYGMGLLNAINGMRFEAPRFAMGGPVSVAGASMALPALGGGGGPSGRPFSLVLGGETFAGLLAPETVAGKMVRFAQTKAVRSAGRKPVWST